MLIKLRNELSILFLYASLPFTSSKAEVGEVLQSLVASLFGSVKEDAPYRVSVPVGVAATASASIAS